MEAIQNAFPVEWFTQNSDVVRIQVFYIILSVIFPILTL